MAAIGKDIAVTAGKLLDYPQSKYYVHESVVARHIGLKNGPIPVREQMSLLLKAIRKGYAGDKRRGMHRTNVTVADLELAGNGTNILVISHGEGSENFPGGTLNPDDEIPHIPRYFAFGSPVHSLKDQINLLGSITGTDTTLSKKAADKRKDGYRKWYAKVKEDGGYSKQDLPAIAAEYANIFWREVKITFPPGPVMIGRRAFQLEDLDAIEKDMRELLKACNKCGARDRTDPLPTLDTPVRMSGDMAGDTEPGYRNEAEVESSSSSSSTPPRYYAASASPNSPYPVALRKATLSPSSDSSMVDWKALGNLASLELLVELARDGKTAEAIPGLFRDAGITLPTDVDVEEVTDLSPGSIGQANKVIKEVRAEYEAKLHCCFNGMFLPGEDEMLYQWMADGRSYSSGRRLQADNYTLNDNNRRPELSTAATVVLRHVCFVYNIPLKALSALWVIFNVLILRRVLTKSMFSDSKTIWAKIMQLTEYDHRQASARFKDAITKKSKYGFTRYFGATADDSDHWDVARHVMVSADIVNGEPSFRHLSCSSAPGKDAEGNAQQNFKVFREAYDDEVLGHFVGMTTDNADTAKLESTTFFGKIHDHLSVSDNPDIAALTVINGVDRWPIFLGDLFHIDNLTVTHASKEGFGDTENANHRQVHHRQLLMSMHSLNSKDRTYANMAMADVMAGSGRSVRLQTTRERAQRWLVNQRYAAWALTTMKIMTLAGMSCLVAWGLYFHNNSRCDWKRRVGREVATWLESPSVKFGLVFEAELGNYFENTYYWHNRPGALHSRPGYRTMELHELYFGFMLPFWTNAVENPEEAFPESFRYVEENFDGDEEKSKRRKQITDGIKAGYDELIKMTEPILLRGAVSFLILCNNEHGPAFCRALLAVVHESGYLPDAQSDAWGEYAHEQDGKRPADEERWYDILSQDAADTVHWYRQFCLDWDIVQPDMKKLSKENASDRGSGIAFFKLKYPVLFDALYAVFGLLPSNSRLCEQIHGMLRHSLRCGIGMDQSNAQYSYMVNIEYWFREARRDLVNSNSSKVDGDGTRARKVSKHDRTKEQVEMMGEQMLGLINSYALADFSEVRSVREITKAGRREQDKTVAKEKEALEKEKQARMQRTAVTIDEVRADAAKVVPDFNLNRRTEGDLARRKVTEELSMVANWDKPFGVLQESVQIAFPLLSIVHPYAKTEWENIKSKTALKREYISPYLRMSKEITEKILDCLYGEKKARTNVPKRDGSHDATDVMSIFFVNYDARDEVDLSRQAAKAARDKAVKTLVSSIKEVDSHYIARFKSEESIDDLLDASDVEEEVEQI